MGKGAGEISEVLVMGASQNKNKQENEDEELTKPSDFMDQPGKPPPHPIFHGCALPDLVHPGRRSARL
jgi:hypothetical protein